MVSNQPKKRTTRKKQGLTKTAMRRAIKEMDFDPKSPVCQGLAMLKPDRDFLIKRTIETLLNGDNSNETLKTAYQFLVMAHIETQK